MKSLLVSLLLVTACSTTTIIERRYFGQPCARSSALSHLRWTDDGFGASSSISVAGSPGTAGAINTAGVAGQ
jgi:hypothetical protein